jgi:predicted Mrr-cat superfamily restriction endonuclease
MGMENYSAHQQKIIKRYYENIDQVAWQRLSELVADLYLAEGKKRDRLWTSAASFMQKLKVPQTRIDVIVAKKDVQKLAELVKELMGKE